MRAEDKLIMTPGPTEVSERVRQAMAKAIVNPDLDEDFFAFYDDTCRKLQKIIGTKEDVLILNGEGILGLEAAVACLIEPGDRVLCLDNGVFGRGFADFVQDYGGEVVFLSKPYNERITEEDVRRVLEKEDGIKAATMVHCETPAGLLNPVEEICPVLREYGVLSIVDAVASLGGEPFAADEWGADMVLGGSQKVLSAPPGLSIISISKGAWAKMESRKQPFRGYYLNLLKWKEMWHKERVFPYTQPVSDLYALAEAADILLEEGDSRFERHALLARAVRETLHDAGIEVYPEPGAEANTVTAFLIPPHFEDAAFRKQMWEKYGVMLAGSWGELAGKVWRIGHMGENARPEKLFRFFLAFDACCADFGYSYQRPLALTFAGKINNFTPIHGL